MFFPKEKERESTIRNRIFFCTQKNHVNSQESKIC